MLSQIIFGYIAGMIILLSGLIITRRNPVHSVLLMLLMFFHIAGLYLTLNAEFMAAIQVIVYAGAILVLFLFVVLMLNLKEEMAENKFITSWPAGLMIATFIAVAMFFSIQNIKLGPKGIYTNELINKETHTVIVGKVMYTEYLLPFEVASLILLVAILGAVVLAKKKFKS